ncbi:hypothetical protein [Bathymodiolus thermophilus thioautotrophic gill symbiont]|nr:hypothetical protein [Bathymodiolus thermophilus thioautotrophic gill symbiont]
MSNKNKSTSLIKMQKIPKKDVVINSASPIRYEKVPPRKQEKSTPKKQ